MYSATASWSFASTVSASDIDGIETFPTFMFDLIFKLPFVVITSSISISKFSEVSAAYSLSSFLSTFETNAIDAFANDF